MIRVLIVDDSKVIRDFLAYILVSDPEIRIAGTAGSGEEAIARTIELKPDVITMDINMPGIDGVETTRRIMESMATPIVIVSGSEKIDDRSYVFRLMEAGALAVVRRPPDIKHAGHRQARAELLQAVKLMSEVKVVRLIRRKPPEAVIGITGSMKSATPHKKIYLIAIGASTGGPASLQKILSALPKDLNVPVVIVQHITKGFVKGLQEWLSGTSSVPVKIAAQGERLQNGIAYFAPDDFHLGVSRDLNASLFSGPPENGLIPAVDYLFRSVAENFGANALGILLTGMGRDGAQGMKTMKEAGAVTIAQDQESSIVYGMPGEAVKLGAVSYILPPDEIAVLIGKLLR
ncbi:MAG: chemotaxis-specific protein-glutamate methyltransferase CheB [Bacteroidales bacterium]